MLKETIKRIICDLNDDADANPEYLRGQVELAMNLLGYSTVEDFDGDNLRAELTRAADGL